MSMLDQFQKLDDLIVEHTVPPVRTILRNQLALAREQIEAYQASSDKQDETLARQAETIATLKEENKKLVATIAEIKALNSKADDDARNVMAQRAHKLHHGKDLNYNV